MSTAAESGRLGRSSPAVLQAVPQGVLHLNPWALGAGLAAGALAVHASLWGLQAPLGRGVPAGALLLAVGLSWVLWASWALRRVGTPLQFAEPPVVFVDEGPFRLGRHPMYLGMATLLLALGLLLGVPTLAAAALAFVAVVNQVHIPHEEAQLRRRFGGWYSDYAANVRRWF